MTTTPANDAVVETAPRQVLLRFSEDVETAFGAVRVFDEAAQRVDDGSIQRPAPDEVSVRLRDGLGDGTYTVAWRVVSADSHPVHGAFVFHVGASSAAGEGVAAQVLDAGASDAVELAFGVVRFVSFALLLVAAGGIVSTLVVVRRGEAERVRARLLAVTAAAAAALAVVSVAGIALQGAYAGGFGFDAVFRWSVFREALGLRFGEIWLARACLAAGLVAVALAARRGRELPPVAGALALALAATPALAGHADVTGAAAVLSDTAHVVAAAAWGGGLLFLLLALAWSGGPRWHAAARLVPRFSTLAVVSVAVLLVAGTVNGYLQVRSWRALIDTTYGRLLLVKVALVVPLLVLGAFNKRFSLPRLRDELASAVERRRFVLVTATELSLVVVVLAVTAALVNEPPARAQVQAGPFSSESHTGPYLVNLTVDPALAGSNAVHVYLLSHDGQPARADEARVSASLPTNGIGPLRLRTELAGPGHYVVPGADLPLAGTWHLELAVRRGEFDEWTATFDVPIRKDTS
jgi:copper transport protein